MLHRKPSVEGLGREASPHLGPASMPLFRVPVADPSAGQQPELAGPGFDEASAAALISGAHHMLPLGSFGGLGDRGLALEQALRDRHARVGLFDRLYWVSHCAAVSRNIHVTQ